MQRCRRCAGPMFPDEEGERFCLICGERTYDWVGGFLDRLLEAMERQAVKEATSHYGKSREREHTTEARRPGAVILGAAKDPHPRSADSSSLRSSE